MAAPERMSRGRYWRNPTGTVHPKTVGGTRLYIRPRTRDSKPIGQVLSPLIRSRTLQYGRANRHAVNTKVLRDYMRHSASSHEVFHPKQQFTWRPTEGFRS